MGYISFYQPEHPHSDKSGHVRAHRIVVERYLGRYLTPEEIVHHVNENKQDNRIENLIVFEDESYHKRWHHKAIGRRDKNSGRSGTFGSFGNYGIVLYGLKFIKESHGNISDMVERTKRDLGIH